MYDASWNSNENYNTLVDIANNYGWTAEDMLRYLTDWHGMQLIDKAFMENLINCEL